MICELYEDMITLMMINIIICNYLWIGICYYFITDKLSINVGNITLILFLNLAWFIITGKYNYFGNNYINYLLTELI